MPQRFATHRETEIVDWVNPDTGEVIEADALVQCLKRDVRQQPDFIDPARAADDGRVPHLPDQRQHTALAHELHNIMTWKQPEMILSTLGGRTTYLGIRPA